LSSSPQNGNLPQTTSADLKRSYLEDMKNKELEETKQFLEFLLSELLASGCFEWALLIATVALNYTKILDILSNKESPGLWNKFYKPMLSSQKCVGYKQLLHHLAILIDNSNAEHLTPTKRIVI